MNRPPLFPLFRAAVVLLLGVLFVLYLQRSPVQLEPEPTAEPLGDTSWVTDVTDGGPGGLYAGKKVVGPLKGQKKPPCDTLDEVEVDGACWAPHLRKPPCSPTQYEAKGMCLLPIAERGPPSTSLDK